MLLMSSILLKLYFQIFWNLSMLKICELAGVQLKVNNFLAKVFMWTK